MNLSVKKDGKNPHFKSDYITLDWLISVLQPVCNELSLLIKHHTKDGVVITEVIDIEQEKSNRFSSSFPLGSYIDNPQKVWSAITYAKRYNLCQIFNIITDRDDDWNKASVISEPKKKITKQQLDKLLEVKDKYKSSKEMIEAVEKRFYITDMQKASIEFIYQS